MKPFAIVVPCLLVLGCNSDQSQIASSESPLVACPTAWVCPPDPAFTSTVGAWYSAWYQPTPNHWQESRYTPTLGTYFSINAPTISSHFSQMRGAGIDFAILDDTNGVTNDYGNIDLNIRAIFDTNETLPNSQRISLALAIGYALWGARDLTAQQAEADYVFSSFAARPSYLAVDAKPLLVNLNDFGSGTAFAPQWTDPRFSVRNATGMIDVSNPYEMPFSSYGWWGWVQREPVWVHPECVTVMPGWNTQHLGRSTVPIDRESGDLYQRQWLEAIAQNPRFVVISSWNDFLEETAIEPATSDLASLQWRDSYGVPMPDLYLQLTSAYANLRTGLMPGYYYRDEDDPLVYLVQNGQLVYQGSMPSGKVVTRLPAGTISSTKNTIGAQAVKGSGPAIYLIQNGIKRPIGSWNDYLALGFASYTSVSDATLNSFPTGPQAPSLPSKVVRNSTSGSTYLIDRGVKRPVTSDDLAIFGWSAVSVADSALASLPSGPWLQWPVKLASSPDVYLVGRGRKQYIHTMPTLYNMGWSHHAACCPPPGPVSPPSTGASSALAWLSESVPSLETGGSPVA